MGLCIDKPWVTCGYREGANLTVELTKDTLTAEAEQTHPADAQKTGSGSAEAIGGGDAPTQTASETSHGGEGYPGPRAGGETDKLKEAPQ